jgi:hypothetical protein
MNTRQLSPAEMASLSDLAFKIAHNEKTRPYFAQLVKAVAPAEAKAFNDVFIRNEFAAFKKQIDDDRMKDKMEKVAEQRQAQRNQIQRQYKYSDAQMGDVQKLYDQYGDWEAAQALYAKRNPPENPMLKPPKEVVEMGSSWEFPTVPGPDGKMLEFKDYVKDPRKHSNNLAIQMITDFKRGKLSSAFA